MSLPVVRACMRAVLLAAWLGVSSWCAAQGGGQGAEYQVKAAFLYKFAGYVEWPDEAGGAVDAPFTIAVLGSEPLVEELQQVVRGRTLADRSVAVRRLKLGDSLTGVRVLFLGKAETPPPDQLRQWTHQRPVLVVSESEGALHAGSMINFVIVERRVRFEIALDTAEANGLRLSSRLLAVAQKVLAAGAP